MSALGDSTPYSFVCYFNAYRLLRDSIEHLSSDEQAVCRVNLASLFTELGRTSLDAIRRMLS